jgi:hypothetical protein
MAASNSRGPNPYSNFMFKQKNNYSNENNENIDNSDNSDNISERTGYGDRIIEARNLRLN